MRAGGPLKDEALRRLERLARAAPDDLDRGAALAAALARAGRVWEAHAETCRLARAGSAAARAALEADLPRAREGLRCAPQVERVEVEGFVREVVVLPDGVVVFGPGEGRVAALGRDLRPAWTRAEAGARFPGHALGGAVVVTAGRDVALWDGATGDDVVRVRLPTRARVVGAWADLLLASLLVDGEDGEDESGLRLLQVGAEVRTVWSQDPARPQGLRARHLAPGLALVEGRAPLRPGEVLRGSRFTAHDVTTGAPRWSASGKVLASDRTGVLVEADDALEERDLEDGAVRWRRDVGCGHVQLGEEHLLVEHQDPITVLPRGPGPPRWTVPAGEHHALAVALARDVVYVATWAPTSPEVTIRGHDLATGGVLFVVRLPYPCPIRPWLLLHPLPSALLVVIGAVAYTDASRLSSVVRLTAP